MKDLTLDCLMISGNSLEDRGFLDEAYRTYFEAHMIYASSPLPLLNMGNILFSKGNLVGAKQFYLEAISLGDCVPALINVGNIEFLKSNYVVAASRFLEALAKQPNHPKATLGYAHALIATGQDDAATEFLETWLAGGHNDSSCRKLYADLLCNTDPDSALQNLDKAGNWDAESWYVLSKVHKWRLEPQDALEAAIRALEIEPGHERARTIGYFLTMLVPEISLDKLEKLHILSFPKKSSSRSTAVFRKPIPERKIRVGYVSGDFKQHAVSNYLYPIIKNHSDQFSPIIISNTRNTDFVTSEFKKLPALFIDISKTDTVTAKKTIRELDLDILCDCSGQTADNRLDLFDERFAALQLTFLGTSLTTGAPEIDYRIVHKLTDPPEAAQIWNRERLAWLDAPGIYHEWISRPISDSSPCERLGYVTIGFVNNQEKLNIETLSDLNQILESTNSRMKFVGVTHPYIRSLIEKRLSNHLHRVNIYGRVSLVDYYKHINDIDIAYDSYPYTGATTTLDCLISGVTVFSRVGDRSHTRSSYFWLSELGLAEYAFSDREKRIEEVIRTCRNPQKVIETRQQLPDKIKSSEIMQPIHYTRKLEELYCRLLSSST